MNQAIILMKVWIVLRIKIMNLQCIYLVKYQKKIPKEDTQNYKEAIKKIEESKPLLTKHMIEKANKEASNNEFGNALSFIDQGLKNDPNNKELISLKNKCEKQNDAMQAAQDKANAEAENVIAKLICI